MEKAQRRWPRPPTLATVLGAGLVVWAVRTGVQPLSDNSFFTHLTTGHYILDELEVPSRDLYSFTAPEAAWVVQSWLASVVYAVLDEWQGGHAVLVANGVLAGTLGALVWRLSRSAVSLLPRFGLAAVVVGVGTATWVERPLLFGLVGMAVLVLVTEEERIPAWVVVPVLWLWVNSHGSWPLGLILIAVRLGGRLLESRRRTLTPRELQLLAFTTIGVAAAAVNPMGPRLLLFPVELVGERMDILNNIVEWRAPELRSVPDRLFLGLLLAGGALLTRNRGRWADALVLVVFGALALTSARNVAVANVVLVPVVARGLRDLGSLRGAQRGPAVLVAAAGVGVLGAMVVSTALSEPAVRLRAYPVQMLARAELAGIDGRMATQDFVGNLVGALEPDGRQVFMDDRYDMWPRDVVDDYRGLLLGTPRWDDVLDDRRIEIVVWGKEDPLGSLVATSPDWHVVATDGRWLLAQRR